MSRLLRPDQVAQELNCSRRQVYRLIDAGCFDIVPIGRSLRITRASFEQYIDRVSQLFAYDRGFSVPPAPGDDPRISPAPMDVGKLHKKTRG
jgi:excisionase family DNA binding protein